MDIAPVARGSARLWHHEESELVALAVWTERVPSRGEDADPLMLFHRPSGRGLIAVFDGVGGAGRAPAGRSASGVDRTQAWVAARQVRGLVEEWFVAPRATGLGEQLTERMAGIPCEQSRLRGTIHRSYPTTLAAIDFRLARTAVSWDVLWAGDSRCYVAEPDTGLQQLSRDDTELHDTLEQLVQDPPMTNLVSAGRPFVLNRWHGSASLPCLLMCATDGFFGYVDTPAQFEQLLWSTLLSAQDLAHWSVLLTERVSSYTGDDASLVLVTLGVSGFDELRVLFRRRAEQVRREHAESMDQIRQGDQPGLVTARERSWLSYRSNYERRLPGVGGKIE
jgi:serine/threonine protein phosphatase PrpC